jgi:prevent-host-death family protein
MKTMGVGEFKARFSEAVEAVRRGEEIVISYGRKHENLAVLVPFASYRKSHALTLGALSKRAAMTFGDDFEMTTDELVNS